VPAGAYMAYSAAPNGAVIGQCVVVPQMAPAPVPMPPAPAPAPPAVYNTPPPAPAQPTSASTVLYDANHNPIGVLVTNPDGSQHFVPVGK
jgi:hypothetical protein